MNIAVDHERLAQLKTLQSGSHSPNDDGKMCAMEAVSWVTHKEWGDHPPCVCPVLGAFMRAWNDGLPTDEDRAKFLLPLIPKLVSTKGSEKLEQRRATMAADWYIRVHTPAWLRLAKLNDQAALLEALPEITDFKNCPSLMMSALTAVRKDANAAWDAAWAAAWDAAGDAAGAAAWAAAWAAARDALKPTVDALQLSALELAERMIAERDE